MQPRKKGRIRHNETSNQACSPNDLPSSAQQRSLHTRCAGTGFAARGGSPSFAELHAALEQGELWGWWRADILICGVILLPLDAPCRLCIDTAVLTGISGLSPDRLLLLWAPAVRDADDAILNAVAQLALERAAARRRTGVLAAFPVRARAGLGSFFSAGFQLVGLRPLLRLCPCLLLLAPDKKPIIIKGINCALTSPTPGFWAGDWRRAGAASRWEPDGQPAAGPLRHYPGNPRSAGGAE